MPTPEGYKVYVVSGVAVSPGRSAIVTTTEGTTFQVGAGAAGHIVVEQGVKYGSSHSQALIKWWSESECMSALVCCVNALMAHPSTPCTD